MSRKAEVGYGIVMDGRADSVKAGERAGTVGMGVLGTPVNFQ